MIDFSYFFILCLNLSRIEIKDYLNLGMTFYKKPETKNKRRDELGRAGWTLLHSMASKYPENPKEEEKRDMDQFFHLFAKLFPCVECSMHFRMKLRERPPQLDSNKVFTKWLCEIHNDVNRRLGKREFNCSRLDERWDCGCTE